METSSSRPRRPRRPVRSSDDTLHDDRPLPYVAFSEDDIKNLIAECRAMCSSPGFLSLTVFHARGSFSHEELRPLLKLLPTGSIDRLMLSGRARNGVSFSFVLNFSSPSYYGRDVYMFGGTREQQDAAYGRIKKFFDLRSRGRGPAALAFFGTLALGGWALVAIIGVILWRALHLLGQPELGNAVLEIAVYMGALAAFFSMVFVSEWITPHVATEGWGRFRGRRRILNGTVSAIALVLVGLALQWLVFGQAPVVIPTT